VIDAWLVVVLSSVSIEEVQPFLHEVIDNNTTEIPRATILIFHFFSIPMIKRI